MSETNPNDSNENINSSNLPVANQSVKTNEPANNSSNNQQEETGQANKEMTKEKWNRSDRINVIGVIVNAGIM